MRPSRHILAALLFVIAVLLFTSGCYQQHLDEQNAHGLMNDPYPKAPQQHADHLKVLVWSDTVSVPILADFEKRYKIKVDVETFAENDEAYEKVRSHANDYDVVMISQYMAYRMKEEKLLQRVPRLNPFIYSYISPYAIDEKIDPQMNYFVPFDYSALGISFNINYTAGFPKTWEYLTDDLENSYLYGRIIMPDDMRYSFAAAMLIQGIDPQTATLEDLERTKKMLIANVRLLGLRFVSFDKVENEQISNESILAVTWSGSAGHLLKNKQDCRFLIPEGKSILSLDGFVIPSYCENPQTAALFIEYMLHPYVSWVIANECMYASVNTRTMKYVDRLIVNGPSCMTPDKEDIIHMKPLSEAELREYEKAWVEVKATPIDREKIRIIPVN